MAPPLVVRTSPPAVADGRRPRGVPSPTLVAHGLVADGSPVARAHAPTHIAFALGSDSLDYLSMKESTLKRPAAQTTASPIPNDPSCIILGSDEPKLSTATRDTYVAKVSSTDLLAHKRGKQLEASCVKLGSDPTRVTSSSHEGFPVPAQSPYAMRASVPRSEFMKFGFDQTPLQSAQQGALPPHDLHTVMCGPYDPHHFQWGGGTYWKNGASTAPI